MVLKVNKPAPKPAATAQAPTPAPTPSTGGLSFLKRGKAAQETFAAEEHKADVASKNKGSNIFRFFVPQNKDASITFLDGNLSDGTLDIPFYYEHNVNMNGKWNNFFICTQDEEPCPICEGGSAASYVGVMTVIDHSSYVSKKDNKTYKDQVRLFVAKRDTIKMLQKAAVKRGGLRGCRFDVSRTGDKSPSVGSMFDFTEKLSEQELISKFGADPANDKSKPIDYSTLLANLYLPAPALRKLGFGSTAGPIGGEPPMSNGEFDADL